SSSSPPAESAANSLHSVAHACQHRSQPVTLIALYFNRPVADRPARATALLERGGEFQQPGFIEGEVGYGRHALAPSALCLPAQPDDGGTGFDGFLVVRASYCPRSDFLGISSLASHNQASRQVHDLTLDQGQRLRRIVHLP